MKGEIVMMRFGFGSGYGCGMLGGGFGMILPIILIGLIIFLVARSAHGNMGRYHRNNIGGREALDILDEKFATGEITEEEYKRRKKILRD